MSGRGRTQTDSKRFDSVDGTNIIKYEWKTFNPENGLHLKITGCNNDYYYIAKEEKQSGVIFRAFKDSSTNMEILSLTHQNIIPCWKLMEKGKPFPNSAFRVYNGLMYICIGKHQEKGIGRVEIDEDDQWQFIPENGADKESYNFEVLC